jgi:hypothetical protein
MAGSREEVSQLLPLDQEETGRKSDESVSSASTTSLVFERIGERAEAEKDGKVLNGNGHTKMVTPKFPREASHYPTQTTSMLSICSRTKIRKMITISRMAPSSRIPPRRQWTRSFDV